MSLRIRFVLIPLFLLFSTQPSIAQVTQFQNFITRSGNQLMDGKQEVRFISFNIPNINFIEDEMAFCRPHEFGLPTAWEIRDALETVKQLGGPVIRGYTFPVWSKNDPENVPKYVLAPGKFDERSFATMDTVLALANEIGMRIIMPLVDSWKWLGGRPQYAAFRNKNENTFWNDAQLIDDFKQTIKYVLTRTNKVTGVEYRNDKAIFCWETGNEVYCPHSWTHEIVAYIKSLDKNHLVMDGGFAREESIADPIVDIVTAHFYFTEPDRLFGILQKILDSNAGRKPFIIGEFGFTGTPMIEKLLDWTLNKEIAGTLGWSIRYHRSEGGFYWHSEPLGLGVFKAYHWPGFPSGDEYDEINYLRLMRQKAFEIRGLPLPPVPVPQAPYLLPIENPTAISWRGSVGAATYDVLRSSLKDGPWEKVGYNVSDAAVQYQPLFQDKSAEIGQPFFYRVIAKNESGISEPSNVVGPVVTKFKARIDEMSSFTRLYYQKGKWRQDTKKCRKFKEDMTRLEGDSGAVLIYRTPGQITGWKIFSFTESASQNLVVSLSGDEKSYQTAECKIESIYNTSSYYDYWRPVVYKNKDEAPQANFLKIELLEKSQIAQVEIYYK